MNLRTTSLGLLALSLALSSTLACGKKDKKDEDLGESLGNALVLSMAKDQYAAAKAKYDKGEDASGECILDTNELRKNKAAEAQQLAKDIDRLCEVDVPARTLSKRLDDTLADVTAARTDKSKADTLPSEQVLLKFACDDTDERLGKIVGLSLSGEANAKALQSKRDAACTQDNLTGGPLKQAKRR